MYGALSSWIVNAADDPRAYERPCALGQRVAGVADNLRFLTQANGTTSSPGFKQIAGTLRAMALDLEIKWDNSEHSRYIENMGDHKYWRENERIPPESLLTNAMLYASKMITKDDCALGEDLVWFRVHADNFYTSETECVTQLHPFLRKYYIAGRLLSFVRYGSLSLNASEAKPDCYLTIQHSFTHELACFRKIYPNVDWGLVTNADQLTDGMEKHWKLAEFEKQFRSALENPLKHAESASHERSRLAYELLLDDNTPIAKSLLLFNQIMAIYRAQPMPDQDYDACMSQQSLKNIAEAYAEKNELPALPERERGRPKKTRDPLKNH